MREIILEELKKIEEKENVKIILAVESGSRAWGFASPDSDYDVRFIYIRRQEDYLRLENVRDVIEWRLDDTLDINGWDIKKALQLLHKSNPTIFEWCASTIVYLEREEAKWLKELLPQYFSPKKSLFHYWHMANSNYKEYLKGEEVKVKKYFYVLRPLMAVQWIIDEQSAPPMLFEKLVESKLPNELKAEVDRLVEMKKNLPEMGLAPRIQIINDYIEREMPRLRMIAEDIDDVDKEWEPLNELFRHVI